MKMCFPARSLSHEKLRIYTRIETEANDNSEMGYYVEDSVSTQSINQSINQSKFFSSRALLITNKFWVSGTETII